ncbi:hypothetical protein Q6312_28670, partial [Klebsiella pneumoniae]|uniref:hypothetical protein n=1 Tax=Klebsiella pneumoniae TaxID=573 RepID=UPI002730F386
LHEQKVLPETITKHIEHQLQLAQSNDNIQADHSNPHLQIQHNTTEPQQHKKKCLSIDKIKLNICRSKT